MATAGYVGRVGVGQLGTRQREWTLSVISSGEAESSLQHPLKGGVTSDVDPARIGRAIYASTSSIS